jgi:hypothetical protein
MARANKKAPGIPAPEANANAETLAESAVQSTLFDRADFIPEASADEAAETARRAVALRDYLRANGSGTLEAALTAAGLPLVPPAPLRACVVNSRAPIVAMREGWAIPSGGIARACLSAAAHGGRIGHYRKAQP